MAEAAAGNDGREICREVAVGAAQIAAQEHLRVVEQIGFAVSALLFRLVRKSTNTDSVARSMISSWRIMSGFWP